jgi:BirA family transcriptional regulator, biotin operon repressor / biotin---[acetyl-CoA-carboxylase] ligase
VIGSSILRRDVVESTQSELAHLARESAPDGTVITARHQTGGRGRRGGAWWDAPGESLLLSVLVRPAVPAGHVSQLSLVAALAVTDALGSAASVTGRIRWPNDVLVDGLKISGILPDAVCAADGRVEHVIIGIGMNLEQCAFPPELAGQATSLRLVTGRAHDPARVEAAVLAALAARYEAWLSGGFGAVRDAWRSRSSTIGSRLRLPDGGAGVAVDVDGDGALLVDIGGGALTRVVSGSVAAIR